MTARADAAAVRTVADQRRYERAGPGAAAGVSVSFRAPPKIKE